MVQTLHPGVYVIEEPASPTIRGVSATTAGFIGIAEKGPSTAQLVTSFTQFNDKFGDFFKLGGSYTYLAFAVQAFFNEGGSACYVARTVPSDAAKALATPKSHDQDDFAGTIRALNEGTWGNNTSIRCAKMTPMSVQTAVAIDGWDGTITVDQAKGLEIGDIVHIDDAGVVVQELVVYSIDTSGTNPVIHFTLDSGNLTSPGTIPVGTLLHTATTHRFRAQLHADLDLTTPGSVTHVDVPAGSTANVVAGQIICALGNDANLGSPATNRNHAFGVVENTVRMANFDRIFLTSDGMSAGGGGATIIEAHSNSVVVSIEFDVKVFENNTIVENHQFLSMSRDNTRDFVGGGIGTISSPAEDDSSFRDGRMYGSTNQSNRVEFISGNDSNDPGSLAIISVAAPLTLVDLVMASGSDGTSAMISNAISSAAIDLFRDIEDVSMFSAPDFAGSIAVSKAMVTHAELDRISVAILDPSLADSEGTNAVEDIIKYRDVDLNVDSSYATMYWPWLVVPDPKASAFNVQDAGAFSQGFGTPTVKIPPSGHVMGEWARTVFERGVHKAPANVTLSGVIDVTKRIGNGEHDFLNPKGINAIRFFKGQGIRIFGARTLFSTPNGKHYVNVRRLLIFIERSVAEGNRFAVFEPNDPALWTQLELVNEQFLRDIWEDGALYPSDDPTKAYFVKVDEETTSAADRRNGRVNVLIGVNPPYPAEFVVFRVSLFDGTTSIEQVTEGFVN